MTFKIIDKKTGKEPTDRVITNIAKKQGLIAIRIDQFAIMEDGQIILLDDCGKAAYLDMNRFEVRWDNGWIPCSERLPEDEQEILFSTKTGRTHSGKYHDDGSANQWYSHRDKARAWNNVVNAWKPLPEPYREDGETE